MISFVRLPVADHLSEPLRVFSHVRVAIISEVPNDWEVSPQAREALAEFLCQRAIYVVDSLMDRLAKRCWPGQLFDKRSVIGGEP